MLSTSRARQKFVPEEVDCSRFVSTEFVFRKEKKLNQNLTTKLYIHVWFVPSFTINFKAELGDKVADECRREVCQVDTRMARTNASIH